MVLIVIHFSRHDRPKELYFKKGQRFELQLMTATIEKVTQDGRPRSVSFAFKKDLSELAWLQLNLNGPKKIQVPAPGEEIQANPWSF
jgi:hypothetical protein